ncbi:MAG: glutathione S-transferase N-terminal domain-containing protein [Pseudomonadota bacterium]
MLTLYSMPGTCALAVHIALAWARLPCENRMLTRGTNHETSYLSVNPLGSVPAIVLEDNSVLTEASAILLFIHSVAEEAFEAPERSKIGRAQLASHLSFLTSELHAAFGPHFAPGRFSPDPEHHQDLRDQAYARIAFLLRHMEEQFEGPYLFGEHRSVADPYLFVVCRWISLTPIDLENFPQLASFKRHMSLDADVVKVLSAYSKSSTGW